MGSGRKALPLLGALLAGCSGPISTDNAILTLPVPDPATDCQHRVTQAQFNGGGPFAEGGFTSTITTVVGAANCPEGLGVVVPTLQRLSLPSEREGRGAIPKDEAEERLQALCVKAAAAGLPPQEECQ